MSSDNAGGGGGGGGTNAVANTGAEQTKTFQRGRDEIEYNEYPDFASNLISDAFIERMVGQFNNEDPCLLYTSPSPRDRG